MVEGAGMSDTDIIREALDYIPANDRDLWVKMAMSVKSELGEAGFELWDAWSRKDDGYNPADAKSVWKSAKANGKITAGTLFWYAKDSGWGGQAPKRQLTDEQRASRAAEIRRQKEETERLYKLASLRALRIYENAQDAPASSAYFRRKGISPPQGVKHIDGLTSRAFGFDPDKSEWTIHGLLVPIIDRTGTIISLQLIPDAPDGRKLFMPGGKTGGGFHVLGQVSGAATVLIAEGLATGQSLRQATGVVVVVAFSASNLPSVARTVRSVAAAATIIICGDDDAAGRKYAAIAAKEANARVIFPGQGVNDFNDLHQAHGIDAVRTAVLGEDVAAVEDNEDWRAELIIKHKDDGTQAIPCRVHNLILILQYAPEFRGRIRYNEFSQTPEADGKEIDDGALARIKAQLERNWITEKVQTGELMEAVNGIRDRCSYHPVRDYLDSLSWDGIERIDDFFSDHLGTPKDPYHIGVSRAFFVSASARIYEPGFKVDLMAIVEGLQGIGKSSMWETLGGEWYADITDDINSKDFQAGLQGVWIADLGELDQFSRAESSRIKSIITIRKDRLRRPYARFHESLSRQAVLVGGSNRSDWINDPTGGRRFLPVSVRVDKIDIKAIANARDQLWAEAVHRYKSGDKGWWDVPDAQEHQQARFNEDPWQQPIEHWLITQFGPLTASDILSDCIKIEVGRQTRSDWTRVGMVMLRIHGWERKNVWLPDVRKQKWAYLRTGAA